MNKKIISILLLICMSTAVFAIPVYTGDTDRNSNGKDIKMKQSLTLDAELGTQWAYDIDTNRSGFKEIIDLDLRLEFNPFSKYSSDVNTSGGPYGLAMVSGLHLYADILDEGGDKHVLNPEFTIVYEQIYGKIVWDPFYLLVGASSKGNHYTRNSGWTFTRSTSRIRANLSHLGYRVQWDGIVSPTLWSQGGPSDTIKNEYAEAMLGLGYIIGSTEMMFSVGSPMTWENNEDNQYDFGYAIESNPFGNFILKGAVVTGVNYDITPLGFAAGLGYRHDLTSSLSLVPYTAFDGRFKGLKDEPLKYLDSEFSFGVSLEWPGSTGWGYDPLLGFDSDRYSGITAAVVLDTADSEDPQTIVSMAVTAFEDGVGGLIPNLGAAGVFEVYDIGNVRERPSDDEARISYGLYLDYNVLDIVKPFIRIKKKEGSKNSNVSFEIAGELTLIPNTAITVGYDNKSFNTLFNPDLKDTKGLIYTEFKVTF